MKDVKEKIIQFIRDNRMGTEEIADCLGKSGLLENAKTIKKGNYCVGEIQYVYGYDDSNWPIHEQIRNLEPGKILFVDDINVNNRALFGQLVSAYILKKKQALGIISQGFMRDLAGLIEDDAKVWCSGITPIGCFNKKVELSDSVKRISSYHREYYEGSIAVCDDSGVVIIPKDKIETAFFEKVVNMHEQEAIWFDCVLNRNWNTYDTVCLKKYLED